MSLRSLSSRLGEAVRNNRGRDVSSILKGEAYDCLGDIGRFDVGQFLRSQAGPVWAEILGSFLRALFAEDQGNYEEAFNLCTAALSALRGQWTDTSERDNPRPNWSLPIMEVMLNKLRMWATLCDSRKGVDSDKLNKASDLLRRFFADCQNDRTQNLRVSRKLGTLIVINNLFKIYFRLNNVRLSKALIKNIEVDELFQLSQKVTYNYYLGRVNMLDGNFTAAEQCLEYAFENCHSHYRKNKTRILVYLVTVKLVRGKFPKGNLLQRYGLEPFTDLIRACRTGNVKLFDDTLIRNQEFFIRKGIYIILQRAKVICYRNLFFNVYRFVDEFSHINFRLHLKFVREALQIMGVDNDEADLDEVECILANLIFSGYVKGYIAHKQRILVLGKQGPFAPPAGMS